MSSVAVLQITDTHLLATENSAKNGLNPDVSLSCVLEDATSERSPDLIVATGDLAHHAASETYERFKEIVRRQSFAPMIAIPGNHDLGEVFFDAFPTTRLENEEWTIIGLDTHIDNVVAGHVSAENVHQLDSELRNVDGHALVIGHHPLVDIGTTWMDKHKVDNAEDILSVFDSHHLNLTYLCGHVHQEHDILGQRVRHLTSPSTCWQFAQGTPTFELDEKPPGWRWLYLNDDGTIDTVVSRLSPKSIQRIQADG